MYTNHTTHYTTHYTTHHTLHHTLHTTHHIYTRLVNRNHRQMNEENTSKLILILFIFPCLTLRSIYAWVVSQYYDSSTWKDVFLVIQSLITCGFLLATFVGREKGVFGQDRWWFSSVHALLFFSSTILLIPVQEGLPPYAWIPLALSVVFGFATWIIQKGYMAQR